MKSITRTLASGQQRAEQRRLLVAHIRSLKTSQAKDSSIERASRMAEAPGAQMRPLARRQQSTTRANYLASGGAAPQVSSRAYEEEEEAEEVAESGKQVGAELSRLYDCEAHDFVRRHIGPAEEEVGEMLDQLGYHSMGQLIEATVPEEIRLERPLRLPEPVSEQELVEELKRLASENSAADWRNFIGLGYYDCVTPAPIMRNIFENPGWTTAYTAYQAEIAQGRLESLMNYQTMVSELTGLDVANASLLDESTAAAEAMQVAFRVDKKRRQRFLMSANCHPQTRSVVATRAQALGIQVDLFDELTNELLPSSSERGGGGIKPNLADYCGLLVQYPNTQGRLFDLAPLTRACREADCLSVVATDLLACTLFKPPGDFDEPADLAVGSAQRFGVPLNFGGPHAGFIACRQQLIRSIPGRVVGLTRDSNGQPAYRFALQTREQHIRRDKATSNICTAQALLANMSAMYAIYHGPEGLRQIAQTVHRKTGLLANLLERAGVEVANGGVYFDTLTVRLADGQELAAVRKRAEAAKINLRYAPHDAEPAVSISLDETTKLGDVFELASLFEDGQAQPDGSQPFETPLEGGLSSLRRESEFLTHPTFNSHHSEAQLTRYMKQLENKDISLVHSMIPLGSCTMKLNATVQMAASSWPEFTRCHPFQPLDQVQGYLRLFEELDEYLCEITGYDKISFQPNSGAQGEYAGLRVIKSYLESRGQSERDVCLIPISAHGTNPASAQMAGFKIQTIGVLDDGNIDMQDFQRKLEQHRERLACMMVTYPSTFGVFDENIRQLCDLVHEAGGQVYLDGANMNAQVGLCRPGDYGSDVSHLNLHKTFCIPHGGGGPGAGPIGVKRHLVPFLPSHPLLEGQRRGQATGGASGQHEALAQCDDSQAFGTVSSGMWGSPAILPISWSYIRLMSRQLRRSSEVAILNANYMRKRLENDYKILYRGSRGNVAHEFIIDCRPFKKTANVEANDIAKRLQDFGFHAPTVSWPVSGTLMLEPTESEDKRQMDNYCEALLAIRQEIRKIESGEWSREQNPVKLAPHTQQVVCADQWHRPYTRQQAAFPATFVRPGQKVWPSVGRVDDTFGDTNLFCTCAPVEPLDEPQAS